MRRTYLLLAIAIVCVGAATQSTSTQSPAPAASSSAPAAAAAPTVANVPMPTLTPEEQKAVDAVATVARRVTSVAGQTAQRAVRDADEGLFREPTAAEAAALAQGAADGAATEIALPGGGAAIETTDAQMNHLVAQRDVDGRVTLTHDVKSAKGGRRDQ